MNMRAASRKTEVGVSIKNQGTHTFLKTVQNAPTSKQLTERVLDQRDIRQSKKQSDERPCASKHHSALKSF